MSDKIAKKTEKAQRLSHNLNIQQIFLAWPRWPSGLEQWTIMSVLKCASITCLNLGERENFSQTQQTQ